MKRVWMGLVSILAAAASTAQVESPDLIVHGGKIVTVDRAFAVRSALAVQGGRIARIGSDPEVLALRGPRTRVVDLGGKTVVPGLIDSHVHPTDASMTEWDHPIPDMETVGDVLDYVRARARALGPGPWISVEQVFITRLREQRYPTRAELDAAAPGNPVVFATGPDASLNTLALRLSGIDRSFKITDGGPGRIELDPATGEPTGILRSATRFVKLEPARRQPSDADQLRRLAELVADYNSVGITGIVDRDASPGAAPLYRKLRDDGRLTVRVGISRHVETIGPLEGVQQAIRDIAADPMRAPDPRLRVIGIKTYLDGGMLTGSAYMREPWGVSRIYSITDPAYRGLLFIPRERLLPIVRTTVESGLQFTAHSVGDGAVTALIDVYREIDRQLPIRKTRPSITHANFMTREAIDEAARLGVIFDVQPAWLYLDTRTLAAQFGYERLRWFQPLATAFRAGALVCGGSDHMQKIGSLRAINPYNPFLAISTTLNRRARWYDGALHPEEALTREQALRMYTANNAYLMFLDDAVGSLEPGKLADFAVLDRDILTCSVDAVRDIKVLETYLGGERVYPRAKP
jgi:predicted amidohydrolase YtcJ